jgi:3-hydroxyisobutyrate dehydrogenase-like beta-hydroxyacid dehydrogenase
VSDGAAAPERQGAPHDIGLIGLGLMGTAITERLHLAGRRVLGYDPLDAARDAHAARGGVALTTIAAVADACDVILLSLPSGKVTLDVCLGPEGLVHHARAGALVIDTSTTHPREVAAAAAGLAAADIHFADAGVSGSSNNVAAGQALGVVGVREDLFPMAAEVLSAFCAQVLHVGTHGDGMRAKLVINAVLSLHRSALAEGLVFAERLGMDAGRMLGVLQQSLAYSKAMDVWGPRMVARDYTPTSRLRQHDKDAQIILELAREHGAPMLGLAQANHIVQVGLANGYGESDNAVLAEVLRMLAGVEPVPPAGRGDGA